MYSKYLKCDSCENVIDRRAKDDFEGRNRNTEGRGTFALNEGRELLDYARSLGWRVSDEGPHSCPKCAGQS